MRQHAVRAWTNPSVLGFAGDRDPIESIVSRVRRVVLEARDLGWSGPPFNPIALAKILNIPVDATAAVPDARTVADARGPRIQYNPQQSRARTRFSVAHEIAHTFFADVGEATRHRGGDPRVTDDWQLELLCNVAAAEMVMPIGSLPHLEDVPPLEQLIRDRLAFDVSVEAYLMRVVSVTGAPVTLFIASPRNAGTGFEYRLDYSVDAETAPRTRVRDLVVPMESVVRGCSAIGSTARGVESWFTGLPASLECVGVTGYPGSLLPRVAGLVHHASSDLGGSIHTLHGDVAAPRGEPPRIVCQLVNDRALRWGGGLARKMAKRHPNAEIEFGAWLRGVPRSERLGEVHFARTADGTVLASLVAQEGYGAGPPRIRYRALDRCLHAVGRHARVHDASVHMPKIGTGGAGAD